MKKIILGSTSVYRAQVLSRSGLPFEQIKPTVDEESQKNKLITQNKSPLEIAEGLSYFKGLSLFEAYPEATIISGDQLVSSDGQILGKPGHFKNAFNQISLMNNKTHELITATTIFSGGKIFKDNNITLLKMKNLTPTEIENYLKLDEPFDCAGSCKIEKHGLSLFESIICSDFSAIEGLPLIWITNTLKGLGYELFKK